MSRVSIRKYGFRSTPEHSFSDDGAYFHASRATINGCEVESTICYDDCGKDLIFRDFRILEVLGKGKYSLPAEKREMWNKLEKSANLGEFNGCKRSHYTSENVSYLMERLNKLTHELIEIIHM